MMRHLAQPTCIVVAMLLTACLARADELSEVKTELSAQGIRALTGGVVLESEGTLGKELGKALLLRRNLTQAVKNLQAAEQQEASLQRTLTQLRQQHVLLSAQLAQIDRENVTLNNRLVGALNAIKGQFELLDEQRDQAKEQITAARAKATESREAYIQFVLEARKLADDVTAEYETKAADPAVQAALGRFNRSANKQHKLAPSSAFQASLRRLKQLEDTVLSESIELRDDGGKTFMVSVVVNGKVQQEMVLDSGASLISLPPNVAAKFGLKPSDKDPKITLQLADGRQIEGHKMTIPSVRVGKFTVENVECAVLGEEAASAQPLLGMSFLEHFKFEVDSSAKTLTMVKVAGLDSGK